MITLQKGAECVLESFTFNRDVQLCSFSLSPFFPKPQQTHFLLGFVLSIDCIVRGVFSLFGLASFIGLA
jgi:hypothetical protein